MKTNKSKRSIILVLVGAIAIYLPNAQLVHPTLLVPQAKIAQA